MATVPSELSPPPTSATVEGAEHRWLRTVYRPGVPQLTVRAVIVGMLLGAVMCLSNLYVVLKTGWSFGVTLTACVVAFALFRLARWSAWSAGSSACWRTTPWGRWRPRRGS